MVKILSICVAFLENMNFTSTQLPFPENNWIAWYFLLFHAFGAYAALYGVGHLHLLKRDHYGPSNSAKFFCKKCWKCKFTASLGRQLPCSKKMHRTSIQSFNWCKIAKEQNNSLSKKFQWVYSLIYSTDIAPDLFR